MNIHEYQAIELFKRYEIPVPVSKVATSLDELILSATGIGFPVVLKAQVLTGGRGKAGGVKKVNSLDELKLVFLKVMGMEIKGIRVKKILVVKALDIKKEVYLGITLDKLKGDIVFIASSKGGVDIEEVAKTNPCEIFKLYLDRKKDVERSKLTSFLESIFDNEKAILAGRDIFLKLLRLFIENDCTLLEINPYAETGNGDWIAADAKVNFDDNSLFRHKELLDLQDVAAQDRDEKAARDAGLSFVKLDGEIGCIVNGAGLAMATMDVIKNLGRSPLNFLDVGGSSSPDKVINALNIILKNTKLKAVLINIFGGITRCDDIANGIIEAYKRFDIRIPIVVRLTGTNESLAREILSQKGITAYTDMKEAVEEVVSAKGGSAPGGKW